jgi:hypothetical protein
VNAGDYARTPPLSGSVRLWDFQNVPSPHNLVTEAVTTRSSQTSARTGNESVGCPAGGCLGGSWFGWVCELGLTRMHGLASASVECLEIDLSARPAHPPDTHRSGGVTY